MVRQRKLTAGLVLVVDELLLERRALALRQQARGVVDVRDQRRHVEREGAARQHE